MNQTSTGSVTVGTLEVPGARLHYEVRGQGPLVMLVGSPMDARSFAPLADLLAADHTVVTADPRGINRSPADDPNQDSTPEMRADDLARIVTYVDAGTATVLGSSGGAVNALALARAHPQLVDTVIAHEPPLVELLPDREQVHAGFDEIVATYVAGDVVEAWRKFLAHGNITMPEEAFDAVFGGERDPQEAADEHFGFVHEMPATTRWQPDLTLLRSSGICIVVGIGEESAGQICDRTARALATALGIEPTMFPGDHTGFAGDPEGFAARLRVVLGSS